MQSPWAAFYTGVGICLRSPIETLVGASGGSVAHLRPASMREVGHVMILHTNGLFFLRVRSRSANSCRDGSSPAFGEAEASESNGVQPSDLEGTTRALFFRKWLCRSFYAVNKDSLQQGASQSKRASRPVASDNST